MEAGRDRHALPFLRRRLQGRNVFIHRSLQANKAYQMNLGARVARGELLIFLHADTTIEFYTVPKLYQALKSRSRFVGGAYQFVLDSPSWKARVIEFGVKLREAIWQLPYGDQVLFAWKKVFDDVGGYPKVPLLEDVLFVGRLKKRGRLLSYSGKAVTSARKWEQYGYLKMTLINWGTMLQYVLGIPLDEIVHNRNRVLKKILSPSSLGGTVRQTMSNGCWRAA